MLNREKIIKAYYNFIESEELEPNQAIVNAGAAIVLLGGRKITSDIDLGLPSDIFDEVASRRRLDVIEHPLYGTIAKYDDYIDLTKDKPTERGKLVYGVWINTPEDILAFKERLNRDKDRYDILYLRQYIHNREIRKNMEYQALVNIRINKRI